MTYDIEQAQTMLDMLAPDGKGLTFQTFDDNADRGSKGVIKQFHGALSTHAQSLAQFNERGAGVFITINATDGKARTKKNITAVRAVYVDFDSADPKRLDMLLNLPLPPSLIVESSTDKHHAYWIADGIPLDSFTQWQKTLISYFKMIGDEPDEAVHDLPRVMRLVGFNHCKVSSKKGLTGDAVMTKIVHQGQRYSFDDVAGFIDGLTVSLPAQLSTEPASKKEHKAQHTSTPILPQVFNDSHLPHLTREQVTNLARGRWQAILGHLDRHVSNDPNEHTACPICGGTDRFRFDDQHGNGSYICSQGGNETVGGDGLSFLIDHDGMSVNDAIKAVTEVLNDMGLISPHDDKTKAINTEWGEPEPLATNPSEPTPFPIHAFTGVLRASIEAISYHTQTPMAMAGFCSLGAVAHIGQRFITAPMGYNSMPTSLFFIIEGDSGSGKSQAMGLSHFKIREHERQLYEEYLSDLEQWENDKASQKGKDIADFLASTPKPQNPMTLFDDATIEPILDRFINGEMSNASWTTDEAGQFFNGHTMQGDTAGNALSALTKLWSDGHVSRVRSQKNQYANVRTQAYDVRMTLLLMGQRIILETALTDEMMNQQGFLARALIACPESLQGTRIWNDEQRRKIDPYNDPAMIAYWSRCHALLDPSPANLPETPQGAPNRIPMKWASNEAENTFYKHMQDIENRQAVGKHLEYLKAYASRMSENASRIAALMAFFDGRMTITTDDITRAFMLVEYSTAERLRYIDATPTGEENDSEKLSRWLVAHCQAQGVQKVAYATVQSRVNPKRLRKKIVLEVVIEELIAKNYIRVITNDDVRFVHINPALLTQ